MKGGEGKGRKKGENIDLVGQKACFIGNTGAKIGRRILSTGEAMPRTSFIKRAQSDQATHKPRVWANSGESP
jgi:hypothetical protein